MALAGGTPVRGGGGAGSLENCPAYSRAARGPYEVYVKIDVGLERLGVPAEQAVKTILAMLELPHVRLGGICAHPHAEPDGDWLNDSTRPLIHAIAPRVAAELALRLAEETDARAATLPLERMWPGDPDSPISPARGEHRGEHLD